MVNFANLATETRCFCPCHTTPDAPKAFPQFHPPSVSRADPEAAVTACRRCIGAHAVEFSGRPPELDAPCSGHRWNPRPLDAVPQADGGTDAT